MGVGRSSPSLRKKSYVVRKPEKKKVALGWESEIEQQRPAIMWPSGTDGGGAGEAGISLNLNLSSEQGARLKRLVRRRIKRGVRTDFTRSEGDSEFGGGFSGGFRRIFKKGF